ncbi:hypothetical protein [Achromobacter phage Motura]|uniref:Uncharacterized protein n=1 Tax=Achromobacter phage Motura TaxID=2591403 RepID=A0A514CTC0_9CAUD|nr:hypothetical protein H1O15_gp103 [Achromobacter phage Motura]QDH83723.1 hypothetical protein [Achromobacter phage Motura]
MSAELKSLQVRLHEKTKELQALERNIAEYNSKRGKIFKDIAQLQFQIQDLTKKDLVVSEHAVLRYLERMYKFDLNEIKSQILTPQLIKTADTLGNGKFPTGAGFKAVVRDRVIVSIIGDSE